MARMRVRARAVDMLGRQQIAGIPTAIHELFKNAHDAYAKRVEVDYFRIDHALMLRDDGYGMTREEFEQRWLTLGTESKVGANIAPLPIFLGPNRKRRPILGEKGIGRLAMATIGPQVLVLTRAIRENGLHDLVVSFIHWGLFEAPGIDLEQIEIPVETFPGGNLPDIGFIKRLTKRIADNVRSLSNQLGRDTTDQLLVQLNDFDIDPSAIDHQLSGPSLAGNGHGTHFFILPVDPVLEDDIDKIPEDIATPLMQMLIGFSNTMVPDRDPPVITARFRDFRRDGTSEELIGESEFFTPEEFESADHHIMGRFDEYGQFTGTVGIYHREAQKYSVAWQEAKGEKTDCGPFAIKFAYVQGDVKESRLPPESFAEIYEKLKRIGGLYIYRDGIRILPYGNSDFDWLNIERRRTKSAGDWFFSYRLIFGAVDINHRENPSLTEKAGREGLRTNKAYRQFKSILENFFMQIAKEYFREGAVRSDEYWAIKEQLKQDAELLKKREKRTRERKKKFGNELDRFFSDIEQLKPGWHADAILEETQKRAIAISSLHDAEEAAKEILKLESHIRYRTSSLRDNYTISKVRGIGFTKKMLSDWDAYLQNRAKLEDEIFSPLETRTNEIIDRLARHSNVALDRRKRLTATLQDVSGTKKRQVSALAKETREEANKLTRNVIEQSQQRLKRLEAAITEIMTEFARTDTAILDEQDVGELQKKLLGKLSGVATTEAETLESILHQIQRLSEAIRNEESIEDETAALESALAGKSEELEMYSDLAQVGTAVGIVHHELGSVIKGVRKNFGELRPWAEANKELFGIYSDLKNSFQHLDSYLKLFTPLSRRMTRQKVPLSGDYIHKYLVDIFDDRLRRHNITLKVTDRFRAKKVEGFPSTFLPCFVNIVDNAIYWIGTRKEGERIVQLDADHRGFIVTNTGPGISIRDAERIFEFGVTGKPGGREWACMFQERPFVRSSSI